MQIADTSDSSSSSSSASLANDKRHGALKAALTLWSKLVGPFGDVADTLCGFFAMECTLLERPRLLGGTGSGAGGGGAAAGEAARGCVFSAQDLERLWVEACDEIAVMVNDNGRPQELQRHKSWACVLSTRPSPTPTPPTPIFF
jgi:hypothetical protein